MHKQIIKTNNFKLTSSGMSLVEMLVALGIMSIMLMVMSSFMSAQFNQTKALSQKLETIEFASYLNRFFMDAKICNCMFADKQTTKIPLTGTSVAIKIPNGCTDDLTWLRANQKLPTTTTNLKVNSVTLEKITDIGAPYYSAVLTIDFDPSTMAGPLHPIEIQQAFVADASRNIVACLGAGTVPACGSANGGAATPTPPSGQLCSSGTPSPVTTAVGTSNPWSWTCTGGGGVQVNCSQAKLPQYNTSRLNGTGSSPCSWFPSILSGAAWGCTCMTGMNTSSPTCTANSFMTHGNNTASCTYTCNLAITN